MLFVENRNQFDHVDRYNGTDYAFPAGEKVPVDEIVAQHCFGWGLQDKTDALLRQGWGNTPDGIRKLKNFVFTPGVFVEQTAQEATQAQPSAASGEQTDKSTLDGVTLKKK